MKKVLILTNLLTVGMLYFVSWKEPAPSCTPVYNMHTTGVGKISPATAAKLASNYTGNVWQKAKIGNGWNTRSVLFTAETLKNFLWQIENETCSKYSKYATTEIGVRIYFAEYPDQKNMDLSDDLRIKDKKYGGRLTVFMVPAYKDGATYYDYDPASTANDQLVKLRDLMSNTDNLNHPSSGSSAILKSANPGAAEPQVTPIGKGLKVLILTPSTPQLTRVKETAPTTKGLIQNHGSLVPPDNIDGNAF